MNFMKQKGIHFAPMEGITDPAYRQAMASLYPEWDSYSTDFLRVPTVGHLKSHKIKEHFSERLFNNHELRNKTVFQILTTIRAQTLNTLPIVNELEIKHLDLNLGCPSRKVNSHGGGSFLLSDLSSLTTIIKSIRTNYPHFFSVKMRLGYRDDKLFISLLKMFEDQGVNAITIHARTRDQLYKGVADWTYIKKAVETVNIPIIGNGDIWNVDDIHSMFEQTNCHGIMVARGATKTPWLAELYKQNKSFSKEDLQQIRIIKLKEYFQTIFEEYKKFHLEDLIILKRFKAFSRYLFDDFENPGELKSKFLRSKELDHFFNLLEQLT